MSCGCGRVGGLGGCRGGGHGGERVGGDCGVGVGGGCGDDCSCGSISSMSSRWYLRPVKLKAKN